MNFSYKQIWLIAYPILISLLMEHMINVTDTAFLGHVGEVELGASALAGVLYMAIYMLGFGFSIGVQILIARKNGERKYGEIGGIFMQGAFFLLALAAVMFFLCDSITTHILSRLIFRSGLCRCFFLFGVEEVRAFLFLYCNSVPGFLHWYH